MSDLQDYLRQLKAQIREVTVEELAAAAPELLLDVREGEEREEGEIPGARWVPRGVLELRIAGLAPRRDTALVLYCASGTRSALAAHSLQALGYTRVRSLAGGYAAWRGSGRPCARPVGLSAARRARYARHLALPEIGEAGQDKLLRAKVLLVGAGGLGAPVGLYLAAAGVGTLGVVDDDLVDASNLQRQVIHSTARVGMAKVYSAQLTLRELNPEVAVRAHALRLRADNAQALLADYDLVVDGTDNFAARYLLNDAAIAQRKPLVSAAVFRFEGQVTVFVPFAGPCYRCLFPSPPPPGLAPACAEAGVLGVLPGLIGLIQATEALKLILGVGEPLIGRQLHYDALAMRFREFKIPRDPRCPACADPGRQI
jgi:molybdopterin/thiamine biosynthesis adenylyltransferase/rhodanese-related sulfurtransferase